MTKEHISELLRDAKAKNICAEWAEKIASSQSTTELLEMYIKGIDFCLNNDFPSNEFLLKHGGEQLQDFGICINQDISAFDPPTLILLGNSVAHVSITEFRVSQVFIKHKSAAVIEVRDFSFVMIDIFDDAVLSVQATDESKVLVNLYGNAKVNDLTTGNARIKIVQKNKNHY